MIPTPPPAQPRPAAAQAAGQAVTPPANVNQRPFDGQQPGEHILYRARPHPLYVILGSWHILLLGIMVLALYLIAQFLATFSTPAPYVLVILFLLFSLHFIGWIAEGVNYWLSREYILTQWRLIDSWGIFIKHRQQAPLGQIQHVRVRRPNVVAHMLDIGSVRVQTASVEEDFDLAGVRNPREWVRQIYLAQVLNLPVGPAPVEMRHPAMQAAWQKLAEVDERPAPTSPLGRLVRPQTPRDMHVPISMLNGEEVLDAFKRHPVALLPKLIPSLLIACVGGVIGFMYANSNNPQVGYLPVIFVLGSLLLAFLWAVLMYLNYVDDLLVLTTHRVVDVQRLFFVLAESYNEALYRKIQDVHVDISFWGYVFNYGTITVETAGRAPNIGMDHVPDPFDVQNRILACITAATERSEVNQRKRRHRLEFRRWTANVLNELLVEIPDVRGMTMLDAAEEVRRLGLRLVVVAERRAAGLPPGVVLEQVPHVGTTGIRGNEVRVILSRRQPAVAPAPAPAPQTSP